MMTFVHAARTVPLAALLALGACAGTFSQVHERFHQTIPVSGAPTVHIDSVAGQIRINAWAKPTVAVEATKYGRDAEELHTVMIDAHAEGRNIFIATKYSGNTHEGAVNYTISVPANASLEIKNVAGTVDIAGVHGDVAVATQAGTIAADLGKVHGNRSIDLSATTGTVRLSIARDSSASVEAHSTVGDFSSDFPRITKSSHNVVGVSATGKIGSGSAKIRLSTTMGAIALREGP